MITVQDIENLANLSRVKINENEKAQLVKEIDSILVYVDQIKKATVVTVSTAAAASVSPEARLGAVRNVARPDEARMISADDRERILAEAPDREGDYIAVKKIL